MHVHAAKYTGSTSVSVVLGTPLIKFCVLIYETEREPAREYKLTFDHQGSREAPEWRDQRRQSLWMNEMFINGMPLKHDIKK